MVGAASELLATGVVLGVSTLAAALLKSATSPVSAMAAVFADRTPAALRNAVMHHFGAHGGTCGIIAPAWMCRWRSELRPHLARA